MYSHYQFILLWSLISSARFPIPNTAFLKAVHQIDVNERQACNAPTDSYHLIHVHIRFYRNIVPNTQISGRVLEYESDTLQLRF